MTGADCGAPLSVHVEPCIPRVACAVNEPGTVTGDWGKLESTSVCPCGTLQVGEEALKGLVTMLLLTFPQAAAGSLLRGFRPSADAHPG